MVGSQEYIDALLAQRDQLLKEVEHYKQQEAAVYDYRLATAAVPIMAAMMGQLFDQTNQTCAPAGYEEIKSVARMACEGASLLCAELDRRSKLQ